MMHLLALDINMKKWLIWIACSVSLLGLSCASIAAPVKNAKQINDFLQTQKIPTAPVERPMQITDGDVRPLMALAVRDGRAYGVYAGKVLKTLRDKSFDQALTMLIVAEREGVYPADARCSIVSVRFEATSQFKHWNAQSMRTAVCPNPS